MRIKPSSTTLRQIFFRGDILCERLTNLVFSYIIKKLYENKYKDARWRMDKLLLKARAKVNLALDVCRRLENGYHEVRMVMQTVDIYDELEFKKRDAPDIILSVNSRDYLGDLENNLIFRAAKLMRQRYGIQQGIEIKLKKNIPVAAGMAGGSTDAASTMTAMNEMFDLALTRQQLMDTALELGADIPFCILGGTALAEGIGEADTASAAAGSITSDCEAADYGVHKACIRKPSR